MTSQSTEKAAFGAVDDQHRLALTNHGVFQCADGRLYRLAAANEACARGPHARQTAALLEVLVATKMRPVTGFEPEKF